MDDLDDVLALERAGWDALCRGRGAEHFGRLMSDDGVMVLADGSVLDRAGVVESLRDAPTWDRYAIEDARLVTVSAAAVLLVYVGTAWRGDQRFSASMTSVYIDTPHGRRLALYQQTVRPDAA